ncbi:MAG: sigma-70 family RNA polymerase sigma factor [Planctomycetota bacterium]
MDFLALQRRAGKGDTTAQNDLIEAFYPRVQVIVHDRLRQDYRRSHEWILPLFSTGDVVQDVFRSVLQTKSAFESLSDASDEEAFVRLCATMVRNRLVDALRHHQAERRDVRREQSADREGDGTSAGPMSARFSAADPTPSVAADLQEQLSVFQEVLESFDERERGLLSLRLVEDASYDDCARDLGYPSPDAARKAFHKAQARLVVRLRARGLRAPGESTHDGSPE